MNNVNSAFTRAYEACNRVVEYNPAWSNGAGQFDFAVYGPNAPKLSNGEFVKTTTPGNRRRIMLIGTRLGNVVVYDRGTDQQPNEKNAAAAEFSYNANSLIGIGGWFSRPWLDAYEMALAVGDGVDGNIGWRLEQLHSALKKVSAPPQ